MKRTIKTTAMSLDSKTMLPVLLGGIEVIVDDVAQQIAVIRKDEAPLVLHMPDLFPAPEAEKANGEAKPRRNAAKANAAEEPESGKVEAKTESAPRTTKVKIPKDEDRCATKRYGKGRCILHAGHDSGKGATRHAFEGSHHAEA